MEEYTECKESRNYTELSDTLRTDWSYAWGAPTVKGKLKVYPQDFYVEELLGFEPSGAGEFLYILIEKVGVNTDYLAKRIAQVFDISVSKISYAGVKDRHACTRQWFCLHVLGKQLDLSTLSDVFRMPEQVRVLKEVRHSKKLKTGGHKGNRFVLRVRELERQDSDQFLERLELIKRFGVPNYFGAQRFGIDGNNLQHGLGFVGRGRQSKRRLSKTEGFWLSAIRSWFFNESLHRQVLSGQWERLYVGDIMQYSTQNQQRRVKALSNETLLALRTGKCSPIHPLLSDGWEKGTSEIRAKVIQEIIDQHSDLYKGFLTFECSREDRLTRIIPVDMAWELLQSKRSGDDIETPREDLILQFELPKGAFATTVMRELILLEDCSQYERSKGREERR
ncbi:tRNA pseudouridine(13) synthase TruD [Marinomonas mediterranea]|jgi:tRNA pseudouridine synthase, TruD family|uniref:tRNA pseudouridine synthase D n=1 Tax=Marinomonas mediterranea (strain ATCC 700492 / JCM 21426 / NBRC 103028 / MMB-1) TaxID=717774 RepID=F2JUN7_MARM1|nr:tRNA pseudouridine(13) synthase TruD [Marinomonas mediterranea]ADZ90452.1 tRNA pseudouridine synthase D [Marinomonas mediterranea MMB-1]